MDVKQILSDAWEAVVESGVPESMHPVAFEQAVRILTEQPRDPSPPGARSPVGSQKVIGKATANPPAGARTRDADAGQGVVTDEDSFFAKFALESGLGKEALRSVYFVKDGQVRIGVARRLLGDTEAQRNRTVAALTVAVRWYTEGKPALGIGEVRDAAKTVGLEVTRNLTKHLEGVKGTQAVGVGNDKGIRVQGAKFNAPFLELIERLTAG